MKQCSRNQQKELVTLNPLTKHAPPPCWRGYSRYWCRSFDDTTILGRSITAGSLSLLDPVSGFGAGPDGDYPAAVGGATTAVGGVVIWLSGRDTHPTTTVLAGGLLGAVLGVLAAAAVAPDPLVLPVQIGLAGAAPSFAVVRGAATERPRQRLGTGLVLLSLAPLLLPNVIRGLTVDGLAGFASFFVVITLVVYTAVLSYPFCRLGRVVQ